MTILITDVEVDATVDVEIEVEDVIDELDDDLLEQEYRIRGLGSDVVSKLLKELELYGADSCIEALVKEAVDRCIINPGPARRLLP